jgi:sarcosine oxidase subunit delta
MKLLTCPMNGSRPCSDSEWAAYVHHRSGAPGDKKEWWYHSPSGTWFIAERNTLSDKVSRTYLLSANTNPTQEQAK